MTNPSLTLPRPPGFSLAASSRFAMNFPASQQSEASASLDLAFALDDTWLPVGVHLREHDDSIQAQIVSNPGGAGTSQIRENITRILNLHVVDDPITAIGQCDPVVSHLQRQFEGLRPVQFPTPWEAAAWSVIGQRIRITHAASIKQRLSERFGTRMEFPGGQVLHGFPGPDTVLALPAMPGLTLRKFDTLRGVAQAALDGALSSAHLLQLEPEAALAELQRLYGIGPFSAELILIRGAGTPDLLPANEPRLSKAMAALYRTENAAVHQQIAKQWQPFRSWVTLLIRQWLEAETHEIATGISARQIPVPHFAATP
ncbi:DNA-3-methyladenine glycosylase family protein [Leucobacter chromiireducens]|uniref:DNA-3-methyladenine glycosylase family protein n=1 Tax=Leucobacter chromiireducens TaxID=283877 RepID=UPI001926B248|nr:DNA-3-methyladenine glycosylase 2 family protein [Leucobacter chromiireducens]